MSGPETEVKEENPSEPLPDVATAAEPGQPAEPEETAETDPPEVAASPTTGALSIEDLEEEASALVHRAESLPRSELRDDKITQTFFKYMKNLSDRRCVEIFNVEVDYSDNRLVFYRRSSELLSFVDAKGNGI